MEDDGGMPTPPAPAERAALADTALAVALEAGALVGDRPTDLGVAATKSSRTDIVTVMDQRAQELIRARLEEARPGDGFLGEEEGGTSPSATGITWVVDPIDGTVNYLYDIPAYAVSVAAVVGDPTTPGAWQPVVGVVVGPALGEVFRATLDGGAWRRRGAGPWTRLGHSGCTDLGLALVGTGFHYTVPTRLWQARVVADVLAEIRDIRRIGSAALDLCHVADGCLDAYFERGLNPWDLAAGWLVVSEAGGLVGGPVGPGEGPERAAPPQRDLTWASGPGIAAAFTDLLARALTAHPGP